MITEKFQATYPPWFWRKQPLDFLNNGLVTTVSLCLALPKHRMMRKDNLTSTQSLLHRHHITTHNTVPCKTWQTACHCKVYMRWRHQWIRWNLLMWLNVDKANDHCLNNKGIFEHNTCVSHEIQCFDNCKYIHTLYIAADKDLHPALYFKLMLRVLLRNALVVHLRCSYESLPVYYSPVCSSRGRIASEWSWPSPCQIQLQGVCEHTHHSPPAHTSTTTCSCESKNLIDTKHWRSTMSSLSVTLVCNRQRHLWPRYLTLVHRCYVSESKCVSVW